MGLRIHFENVVQRYRVIRERPDSLREAFTKIFRRDSGVRDFEASVVCRLLYRMEKYSG